MPITADIKNQTKDLLKNSLKNKFSKHNPEPAKMPFHTRLLGKDRLALYQFIHSLDTNFGTTIFKTVSLAFASSKFAIASSHHTFGKQISSKAHRVIQNIQNYSETKNVIVK